MAIPREDDIEKIDDIAVEDAVGEVAKHSGDKQGGAEARGGVSEGSAPREDGKEDQCYRGKKHEKQVVVFKHAEGRAGVVDLDEVEKTRNHRHELVCGNES